MHGPARRDLFGRIGVKLALFLTLALLPLGLIAVWQTREVSEEIEERARLTLIALTEQAASTERRVIERSLGAAEVLSVIALDLRDDAARCSRLFRQYLDTAPDHSFAGFVPRDGLMVCSSSDAPYDFSQAENFDRDFADPRRMVRVNNDAPISGAAVLLVSEPVFEDGVIVGYIVVSTPRGIIDLEFRSIRPDNPVSLLTFTREGEVISANADIEEVLPRLPVRRSLADLARTGAATFVAADASESRQLYAVTPVVPGLAYAIGRWTEVGAPSGLTVVPVYAFPVAMWLASLAVAYFAVHRVVIKHIRVLQDAMRGFALHRKLPVTGPDAADRPTEFAEMHRTFVRTATILMRDEADLENALHEQKVLLKEVHHRVKNNLQLISSIMSMQIRAVQSGEARAVLRRLQDRVLGLAAIHRTLYQAESLSQVRIDTMLSEILAQIGRAALPPGAGVQIRLVADEVSLYPDQVVPMSLLAAEAVTNALKYVGRPAEGPARIDLNLTCAADGTVTLSIANTLGETPERMDPDDRIRQGDGLGGRLIRAFAGQLSGHLGIDRSAERYCLSLTFKRAPFTETATADQGVA
jgi:two-component sensor histidine kinase